MKIPRRMGGMALSAALICVGVTSAGVPGRWDTVVRGANVPGNSASELGLARTADGVLHVAWKERTGRSPRRSGTARSRPLAGSVLSRRSSRAGSV